MFLHKLEIIGFKSFARKTAFQFNSGITGVVGPNGCGKSNIADAIRWVLGEQRAGTLRSERMENVIFSGSAKLKPIGMAEVALTIKNNDHVLPVEYSEVVITRRLFRSGESQYLLNNSVCRLKDILDLFMDSGMGFDAYSVIELKMVETILSGRPEDRRRIFEQAAGVTKYKQRRIAAFKKLESTEKDLLRLSDIVSEVQKNVDSLQRQVSKARRYQKLTEEQHALEIQTATFQFSKILSELDPIIDNFEKLTRDLEKISAKINLLDANNEALRTQMIQVEQKLAAAQQKLNAENRLIQQIESDTALTRERINAIDANKLKDEAECQDLVQKLDKLNHARESLHQNLEALKAGLVRFQTRFEQEQTVLQDSLKAIEHQRNQTRETETKHLQLLETISQTIKNQERFKTQQEHQQKRLFSLQRDETELAADSLLLVAELAQFETQYQTRLNELEHLTQEKAELEQQINAALETAAQIKEKIFQNKNQTTDFENRIGLLRQLIDSLEDYPEGVRHLMLSQDHEQHFLGALAEQFSIPAEYRLAIEIYLGELATCLLTETETEALSGIQALKAEKKGFVGFLAVTPANPETHSPVACPDEIPGTIARADRVITCTPRLQPLFQNLFSHCFLVPDGATARQLAQSYPAPDLSFVSLQGDLFSNRGLIKGGDRSNRQISTVGRTDELTQLENKLVALIDQIDRFEKQRDQLTQETERQTRNRTALQQRIQTLEQEKVKLQMGIEQSKFKQQQQQERLQKIRAERASIETELEGLQQQLNTLTPDMSEQEQQRQRYETQLQQYRQELSRLETAHEAQANQVHQFNLETVAARSELQNTERELQQNQQLATEYTNTIQTKTRDIELGGQQKAALAQQIQKWNQDLEKRFNVQDELEKTVQRFEGERSEIARQVEDINRNVRGLRFDREQTSNQVHNLELKISELKLKAETIQQRMRTEFEVQIQRAAVDPNVVLENLQNELEGVRSRLKNLGPVNLIAIKEYETEKERLDFLLTQQNDLNEAQKTLNETINLINETAQARFSEVYEIIRKNFREVFHNFFADGDADLVMADAGDILENEIEVVANPKTKRLGPLALLSGGEKTLTAISLLFAIYLVKPSPFCILDEVDAPLDDVNVERFVGAIRKFSGNTQFILVTHNKLTMRAADSLYGITMGPEGYSKVVSVKMEQE
ncbi:chromosome segregation protein SMC [candidate division KSB1 bacterium]|nr:chromosome segregation protein SMC [candidate division KSB1 bacterium]